MFPRATAGIGVNMNASNELIEPMIEPGVHALKYLIHLANDMPVVKCHF